MSRRRAASFRLSRRWKRALLLIALLPALAALRQWRPELFQSADSPSDDSTSARVERVVERVVDGDTLVLAGSKERVRLIGADTPETVKPNWPVEPWGPEAMAFTKELVFSSGGEVRLEFDGPRRDKYGRLLAFVWVGDRMLNEELVRAGLARAELRYPFSAAKKDRLRRAEAEARAARRGMWGEGAGSDE